MTMKLDAELFAADLLAELPPDFFKSCPALRWYFCLACTATAPEIAARRPKNAASVAGAVGGWTYMLAKDSRISSCREWSSWLQTRAAQTVLTAAVSKIMPRYFPEPPMPERLAA